MKYRPTRFQEAVARLCEEHDHEGRAEKELAQLRTCEVARALNDKLRGSKVDDLPALLSTLSPQEKRYLSPFCSHAVPDTRRNAIECLILAPHHARHHFLWRAFVNYFGDETTRRLAQFMLTTESLKRQWQGVQQTVITGRVQSAQKGLEVFWSHCLQSKLHFFDGLAAASIDKHTAFAVHARDHFLAKGAVVLWEQQGVGILESLHREARDDVKTEAAEQCWRNYSFLSIREARNHPLVGFFIYQLGRYPHLLKAVNSTNNTAWRWYKRLLGWNAAVDFFKHSDSQDTSRIEFWEEYFEDLYEASHDEDLRILFLDFESFHVIEFETTGDAAYVYKPEEFERLHFNYQRKSDLKDRKRCMFRIEHRGDWQARTRPLIVAELRKGARERAAEANSSEKSLFD